MQGKTLYRLVSIINGKPVVVETYSLEKYTIIGTHNNPNSRAELQGQPKLEGWYGPAWDHDAIRYETKTAYNYFSQ